MNTTEMILKRRSVRTFSGSPRQEDVDKIMAFAATAENPYGLPIEWKVLSAKGDRLSSAVIVGTDTFIAGKMKKAPHAEEAFGYAFERVLLCAEALGLGCTWIAGTMGRSAFERAMALGEGEVMPCVSPLGVPSEKMSLRETMMRKGIHADSRFDFDALFFSGSFDTPLSPEKAGDLREPLELVRRAPSAVNKQPWRAVVVDGAVHFYEKRSKGYVNDAGWDLQKVDMGIALCHFAMGLEAQGKQSSLTVADPGIAMPPETYYIASCRLDGAREEKE